MKKLKLLSGIIMIITAFLFGGCYTQVAMSSNNGDNSNSYGYSNDQENQNDQTPADSTYGDQYGDNGYYQDQQPGSIDNNYYGYPPFAQNPFWRYNSSFSIGFGWGSSFFDPYYWDPFGLWTSYYPNYWGPNPYYPVYYDPYYSPYWGGNWFYNNGQRYTRSREMNNLRNDNGYRTRGDRNSYGGSYGATILSSPSSTRSEPYNTTSDRSRTQSPAGVNNSRNGNDRNQNGAANRNNNNLRNDNGRNQTQKVESNNSNRQSNGGQRTYTKPNNTRNSSGRSNYSERRR